MSVTTACFGHLTHLLVAASTLNGSTEAMHNRRGVILALEGGYNPVATAESLTHCVAALLSETCLRLTSGLAPTDKLVPFLFFCHHFVIFSMNHLFFQSIAFYRHLFCFTMSSLQIHDDNDSRFLFPYAHLSVVCLMQFPIYLFDSFIEARLQFARLSKFTRKIGSLCLIIVSIFW